MFIFAHFGEFGIALASHELSSELLWLSPQVKLKKDGTKNDRSSEEGASIP
jgi:hypothetical protein